MSTPETRRLTAVQTTIERAVTGHEVGVGEATHCSQCKRSLGEGSHCAVYAYTMSDETTVSVARIMCADCGEQGIEHPTLGCGEWLVAGILAVRSDVAHRRHGLVVVAGDDAVVEHSPVGEGSDP